MKSSLCIVIPCYNETFRFDLEIAAFEYLFRPELKIISGSRIKRLGAVIKRSAFCHYFGRVFATIVTKLFAIPIYDTQCGAKLFHVSVVEALFGERFHSKWMFDLKMKMIDFMMVPFRIASMYCYYLNK